MTTRHLVTPVKQQRLPDSYEFADVRSEIAEQEDGAIHKSTSSAREKPTKVNVDDEGRSRVRSGIGLHVPNVLCDETNRFRRRWLCLWKAL